MGPPRVLRSVERGFWRLVGQGLPTSEAAVAVGLSVHTGKQWFREGFGMPPLELSEPSGRYLSLVEREEIALGLAVGHSVRRIARDLGRAPSTVSREVRRNRELHWPRRYRATLAQARAEQRAPQA